MFSFDDIISNIFYDMQILYMGFFKKPPESARFIILLRVFFEKSKTNYKLFWEEVRPCGVYLRMTSGMH